MRYAIISDVHANLEAFQAVTYAMSVERIGAYISVGDIVGYGADPKACIRLLKSISPKISIAGNHDWAVTGRLCPSWFNEYARRAVEWTIGVIDQADVDYLKSFDLLHEGPDMILAHGTLNDPQRFNYLIDLKGASRILETMKSFLCFVGHSHVPGIFSSDGGRVVYSSSPAMRLESNKRYIVNVGSVGQPRDGDPRAAYVIYDSLAKQIEIKRVEYDIKKAQKKMVDVGLPKTLSDRLSKGR